MISPMIPDDEKQRLEKLRALKLLDSAPEERFDRLTLISNRRGFTGLTKHSMNICRRKDLTVSIRLFDLNKFKPINDTYGHAEGDPALFVFANIMRKVFRESDVFGRIGGDEFAVLIMDVDTENTQRVIERFQTEITAHNQRAQCGYNIEYSIGFRNTIVDDHVDIDYLWGCS